MNESTAPNAAPTAEYIAFAEFRDGFAHGRFHVIVNPELAQRFVANRTHVLPLGVALVGSGIACALAGYPFAGAALVAAGILLRRVIRRHAPQILLRLASRQAAAYHDATTQGVMEVQRL